MNELVINRYLEEKDFFPYPEIIRNIGIYSNYTKCDFLNPNGIWSGIRSPVLHDFINSYMFEKIEKITSKSVSRLDCSFHINPELSCMGAPHHDSQSNSKAFAGVVYLNDSIPKIDCGTTLFEEPSKDILQSSPSISEMQVMYRLDLPSKNIFKIQSRDNFIKYKKKLKVLKIMSNEYNKMVLYYSNVYHSPDFYFGEGLVNSRMTLVFHGEFK